MRHSGFVARDEEGKEIVSGPLDELLSQL
jgi:hypothetical protein